MSEQDVGVKLLEEHEMHSSTWMKIRERLEERLELLRLKNDNSVPPEKTEKLRGRIAEVKALLALSTSTELKLEQEFDD